MELTCTQSWEKTVQNIGRRQREIISVFKQITGNYTTLDINIFTALA